MRHEACSSTSALAGKYVRAKRAVVDAGFAGELHWQEAVGVRTDAVSEPEFLAEASWVVFNAGMRESVVRSKWPALGEAFLMWRSAEEVAASAAECSRRALSVFGHTGKVAAVVGIADVVAEMGMPSVLARLAFDTEAFLTSLPYVGKVTWKHLAKNLGMQQVKEDRHLVRLAGEWGRVSADGMCREIADWVGDPPAVVDLVLWRWCALGSPSVAAIQPGLPSSSLF